jgi:hypothetical protein
MSQEETANIYETINAYLKAIKYGDKKYFERSFYSDSVIINATEEEPTKSIIPLPDFIKRIQARHKEGTYVEEIPHGITISYVGKVSNVRLDFELKLGDLTLFGTHHFNMVRESGYWRISQKIYFVNQQ